MPLRTMITAATLAAALARIGTDCFGSGRLTHHRVQHEQGDELERRRGNWMRGWQNADWRGPARKSRPRCWRPRYSCEAIFTLIPDARRTAQKRASDRFAQQSVEIVPLLAAAQGDRNLTLRHRESMPWPVCLSWSPSFMTAPSMEPRSTKDVRCRGMSPGILRPVETGNAALVHVNTVRKPDENPDLSRAPSRGWLIAGMDVDRAAVQSLAR
jgi:hypothetical protein